MTTTLSWSVEPDGARTVVGIRGELGMRTAPRLRTTLMRALAEVPAALLVDLSAMTVADRLSLSVFTAVQRQASIFPGIPVRWCGARHDVSTILRGAPYRHLVLAPTVDESIAGLEDHRRVVPTLTDQLLPIHGAARHARDLATEVCARWDVPQLIWPASVIANELVTNAVEHANTMITLRFALSPDFLQIAASDGSATEPQLRPPTRAARSAAPRGLFLVQSLAAHWGTLPTEGGKVVWATLAFGAALT